jgi:hypothetical protein
MQESRKTRLITQAVEQWLDLDIEEVTWDWDQIFCELPR